MVWRLRDLTKEDTPMANKHMKRCSTSYVIKECKLKWQDTSSCLSEWPKSGTLTTINAGEDVELKELFYIGGENSYIATLENRQFLQK